MSLTEGEKGGESKDEGEGGEKEKGCRRREEDLGGETTRKQAEEAEQEGVGAERK